VMTLPEWRGQGFAQACMRKAQEFLCEELDVDFGLLMCDRKMVPYYSKLVWMEVVGPLTYDQPQGKVCFEDVVMVFSCDGNSWPVGIIDLCGYPW
jgi:hypothetical protein